MSDELQALHDRNAIVETICRVADALDARDWTLCRSALASHIWIDYSALRGQPPGWIDADAYVEERRASLSSLQTHHISTNHRVTLDGDHASCVSSAMIHRRTLDAEPRTFNTHARYTHGLVRMADGWKIDRIVQEVLWNDGDAVIHIGAVNAGVP